MSHAVYSQSIDNLIDEYDGGVIVVNQHGVRFRIVQSIHAFYRLELEGHIQSDDECIIVEPSIHEGKECYATEGFCLMKFDKNTLEQLQSESESEFEYEDDENWMWNKERKRKEREK